MQLKVEEKETGREWTLVLSEMEACDLTERLMKAEFGDSRATLLNRYADVTKNTGGRVKSPVRL